MWPTASSRSPNRVSNRACSSPQNDDRAGQAQGLGPPGDAVAVSGENSGHLGRRRPRTGGWPSTSPPCRVPVVGERSWASSTPLARRAGPTLVLRSERKGRGVRAQDERDPERGGAQGIGVDFVFDEACSGAVTFGDLIVVRAYHLFSVARKTPDRPV
ncbi:hypothetical protein GQR58_030114 [Nymphon striatum]|nr:hypothetical protein GQR58_030114 [Nymphon striatum]